MAFAIAPEIVPTEAEKVFYDPDLLEYPGYIENGERRWDILGSTDAGRILKVVYTIRNGAVRVVRVITAHDPSRLMPAKVRYRQLDQGERGYVHQCCSARWSRLMPLRIILPYPSEGRAPRC